MLAPIAADSPKVLAVIQARMESTRLPAKVFLNLGGRPVLAHVIERMRHSRLTSDFIVATTVGRGDLPIVGLCAEMGVRVYCGHEQDPLERYYQAARLYGGEHIVRIKGDCPLLDPEIVDHAIEMHLRTGADYTGNTLERSYPVGLDVEILRRQTLAQVWRDAGLASEREHVTLYIPKHPELFKIAHLKQATDLSVKRWTLDYPQDYAFLQAVFNELYRRDPVFGMRAVLDFLAAKPELEQLNAHIPVDAGVRISLAHDHPAGCPQ
ncbi:MAG TPA: glycosyltransferase family protein [Sideroxyarcus sp.]|nr:glycosyltransferase family protein [Sideroxyarcus sp.]